MSETEDTLYESFVVARGDESDTGEVEAGGTIMSRADARDLLRRHVANPDDPPVTPPPMTRAGPRPGPNYLGAPGRVAIVQGQVYIVGVMLVAQLLLVTIGLFELLSGHGRILWWITAASFALFVIALIVYFWPRRRVEGF
ncbi:MAG TPA: hypothetical protein VJN88_15225 [Ktedonobacterales bacterium]|nr:hypothetical protein [Ktedonobacterales bacterium]